MRRIILVRFLLFVLFALPLEVPSLGAQAQPPAPRRVGTIDGIVSDTNLVPLQAAFVSVLGTKLRVGTGPNGRFRITKVPAGQYLVIVKRIGYRPTSAVIDVPATDTL